MAATLEPQVRQEIERRRRKTHDKRIAQRLSAVLGIADGWTQHEVADLLGVTQRQVRKWLRVYRTQGLEALLLSTIKVIPVTSDRLRLSASRPRSRPADFSPLSRLVTGSTRPSLSAIPLGACGICCTASASVTTKPRASSGRPTRSSKRSSSARTSGTSERRTG